MKIIASIPDFVTLKNIDTILNFASGIVLSRTFQILNKKSKNDIVLLTKYLVRKCKSAGKPIYIHFDTREDELLINFNDIFFDIGDGIDGIFLKIEKEAFSLNSGYSEQMLPIDRHLDIVNRLVDFLINFQITNPKISKINNKNLFLKYKSKDCLVLNLIKNIMSNLPNCVIVYIGNSMTDLQNIAKVQMNSYIFVLTNNSYFRKQSKLFYGVVSRHIDEMNFIMSNNFNLNNEQITYILIKNRKITRKYFSKNVNILILERINDKLTLKVVDNYDIIV
jgi:pyruvate kinase